MRTLPPLDPDVDPGEVVAALTPVLGATRCRRLDEIAAGRLDGVACVMEDLLDPHNYGAVLRSCDAMGVLHVHTINSRNRFRVSVRVTQGCERWLEIHPFPDVDACAAALQQSGFRLLAAVPDATLSVDDVEPSWPGAPIALAFGNEHLGLSPRLRALAEAEFRIPMYGASRSLNVSASVAVSLHAVTEARRRRLGRTGDLAEAALLRLRARYYASDVPHARAFVERYRAASR